jgi:hypothetical protein
MASFTLLALALLTANLSFIRHSGHLNFDLLWGGPRAMT